MKFPFEKWDKKGLSSMPTLHDCNRSSSLVEPINSIGAHRAV
jgi:hypothetical protein